MHVFREAVTKYIATGYGHDFYAIVSFAVPIGTMHVVMVRSNRLIGFACRNRYVHDRLYRSTINKAIGLEIIFRENRVNNPVYL